MVAAIKDQENRTLQGFNQEAWAFANIKNRKTQWSVIAQQIVLNQLIEESGSTPDLDLDAWDGYTAARRRFINTIKHQHNTHPEARDRDRSHLRTWHAPQRACIRIET